MGLGTVSSNNVDVTVGVLKEVWLCRPSGAHQLTWDFRETGDISLDKAVFDCSLLVVILILGYRGNLSPWKAYFRAKIKY